MTTIFRTTCAAAILLATSLSGGALAETIRFTDQGPNRGERAEQMVKMFDAIADRTEGRVKIEPFWGGALMKAADALEGLQSGVVGMATLTGAYAAKELHGYLVGNLPIRVDDEVAGAKAMYELATANPEMLAEFEKAGVVFIANYAVGPVGFICAGDPITKLADFAQKKVRINGEYGTLMETTAKAAPVNLPLSEAYQALDTGVTDCSQSFGYVAKAYKLYEPGNQYILPGSGTLQANGIFMSSSAFQRLSEADRKVVMEEGYKMTIAMAEAIRAANKSALDEMADGSLGKKVEVHTFSEADSAALAEGVKPIVDDWIAAGGPGSAEILEAYTGLIEKYSNE